MQQKYHLPKPIFELEITPVICKKKSEYFFVFCSHKFGYRLLDAGELVKLVRTYKESPPQVPCKNVSHDAKKTLKYS